MPQVSKRYFRGSDTRQDLERLGFVITNDEDPDFYEVQLPEGWKMTLDSSLGCRISHFLDERRQERAVSVFPGEYFDKVAPYLRILQRSGEAEEQTE